MSTYMACAKVETKLSPREQFYFDLLQAAEEVEPFLDFVTLTFTCLINGSVMAYYFSIM